MSNRAIADAFAAQFDPPLRVVGTQSINNMPIRDAWLVATHDQATGYGITAHAYAGQLHAFLEVATGGEDAAAVGANMARWLREATKRDDG